MNKRQFILHYLLLNKYSYLFAVFCIFIVNWLQVEIPRYIQLAIDLLTNISSQSQPQLKEFVVIIIGLSLVMVFIRILSRMYALNPGRITEAKLKTDLLHRLNQLPESFHQRFASGKLISIVNNDLTGIRLFFGIGFLQLFNIIFALSLTPIWMWRISPSLTLFSVIPIIFAFFIFRLGFKQLKTLYKVRMKKLQNLSEQLINFLGGIDVIKSQQMSDWTKQQVSEANQELYECTMSIAKIQTFYLPVMDYANSLMKVIILFAGGVYLFNQDLTIGEITAMLSYSILLALPIMHLGRIVSVYQMGMVSIDSVKTILDEKPNTIDSNALNNDQLLPLARQTIRINNLTYSYPDQPDKAVLNNISFSIAPGEKVGVLGSIGSGKSTLVNCINHQLDIKDNQLFLGSQDVNKMPRTDYRKFVKTITQEPYLFSDTIKNNVLFGSPNLNTPNERAKKVLDLSQLTDDIQRFPDGLDTVVGEKGIMLSGGQKQRISIARALLTPCDLIIMDNVLSAVDYETERKILNNLVKQTQNQSVLVVSHRISALENLDKIIVLQNGQVIAQGSHRELLTSCEYYLDTWQLQQHSEQNHD